MKKFLLSIATAVLGIATMSAGEVTFNFATETYGLTRESDAKAPYIENGKTLDANGGVVVTLNKTADKNGWRMWSDGLRIYKNSGTSMTLTAGDNTITGIEFTMAKTGVIEGYSVNGGTAVTVSNKTFTFTVSCNSSNVDLALTVTQNNGAIASMKVILNGEVNPNPPTPDVPDTPGVETTGKGTEAEPYTVADVIALNNPGTAAWVSGYIVGVINYDNQSAFEPGATTTVATCLAIAATAGETDKTKVVAVQLPAGDIRTALNLKDHPENFGKVLAIKGDLTKYFGIAGVKNPTAYKLDGQSSGGETPETPEAPTEGPGSESEPYEVNAAIALNNPGSLVWVRGNIVGVMNYVEGEGNVFSATELTTNTNIVIAQTTSDYGTNYMAIQLPAGKLRDDLNLVDRPGNLGKEVTVLGKLVKYCGTNGMKETSKYTIVGGLAPAPVAEVATLTEFIEEQPATNTKITGAVTVFYQSPDKKYTFITDGTSNIEVYTGAGLTNAYTNGDQLTGIVGKFDTYNNMPQIAPQVDSFGEATHGTAVEPVAATLAQVKVADFVTVSNVNITVETVNNKTNYNVTDGTTTLQLFNRFNIEGVEAAEGVTITGIGAIFGETMQLFPISISGESGIGEINAGNNGAAVIYDLQGRKLSAPVKGINIINGRKVLVK